MDRRSFLARLGFGTVAAAAAATGVLDIERLLWVPGEKTIFIPTVEAVTFAETDWFAMEWLRVMKNQLEVSRCFNREHSTIMDAHFIPTIRVPLPRRYA